MFGVSTHPAPYCGFLNTTLCAAMISAEVLPFKHCHTSCALEGAADDAEAEVALVAVTLIPDATEIETRETTDAAIALALAPALLPAADALAT